MSKVPYERTLNNPPTAEEVEKSWAAVEFARAEARPQTLDYAARILEDWFPLGADTDEVADPSIVAGLGVFAGQIIGLIGNQKGRDAKGKAKYNFGMASPSGYNQAVRVMKLAESLRVPVVTLVDTPGAYPGVAAEQAGQGGTIARTQRHMLNLKVPTVAVIVSEGGSGGAVALAVADQVLMNQNAIYSVISPEGLSSIVWKSMDHKKEAAAALKGDAETCLCLGAIDGIIPEPTGGTQSDYDLAATTLAERVEVALSGLVDLSPNELIARRRAKYRSMGIYNEPPGAEAAANTDPSLTDQIRRLASWAIHLKPN